MSSDFAQPHPSISSARDVALIVFALAFATIAGAWIFQGLGYLPCDLCYEQRYAYYVGVPVAAVAAATAQRSKGLTAAFFIALGLIFAANVVLAIYHSGVELKLWQGPTACSGSALAISSGGDLLADIDKAKVVRCDDVGLRVFGFTLANWNVLISLSLVALSGIGARQTLRTGR